ARSPRRAGRLGGRAPWTRSRSCLGCRGNSAGPGRRGPRRSCSHWRRSGRRRRRGSPGRPGAGPSSRRCWPCRPASPLPPGWNPPLIAASAVGIVTGVVLAGQDARTGANALLIAGGLVAAAGLVTRRPAVVGAGAVIASLAVGSHLETSHVQATDAYLAPVAALLLGWGFHERRSAAGPDRPSSWVAYAPAVVLLGGAALVER